MYVRLEWKKGRKNYHSLMAINLDIVKGGGVYFIWNADTPRRSVCVGHSKDDLAGQFLEHRDDVKILKHDQGGLYVSWAELPDAQHDGVVHYFEDMFRPSVGRVNPKIHKRT